MLPLFVLFMRTTMLKLLPMTSVRTALRKCAQLCIVILCGVSFIGSASASDPKPYPLATCIVSGDKIDPKVPPIVHNNQQVKFCCKGCIKKFNACPDKYMVRLQGADAEKKK